MWRLAHDAFFAVLRSSALMPVRVTLRVATNIVAAALYIVYTRADLSRWGGVIYDSVFAQIPTETDPAEVDYTKNETSDPVSAAVARSTKHQARALHAFNPKLSETRRAQLSGRALLGGGAPGVRRLTPNTSTGTNTSIASWAKMMCWTVIDSGCSWHCHPHLSDLINTRACSDTMSGIDGKPQRVKCIGDLPALARDHMQRRVAAHPYPKRTLRTVLHRHAHFCRPALARLERGLRLQ